MVLIVILCMVKGRGAMNVKSTPAGAARDRRIFSVVSGKMAVDIGQGG